MLKCNLPQRARANLIAYESFLKQKNMVKAANFARNICLIHVMVCIYHLHHHRVTQIQKMISALKCSVQHIWLLGTRLHTDPAALCWVCWVPGILL